MELLNNEYYITLQDVLDNSEFTEPDLIRVYDEKIDYHLKDISSKVYSIMYSAYRGIKKERQVAGLQYIINNDTDKQAGLLKAMVEYVRGDMLNGLGLAMYEGKGYYSNEVINILKRNGLWIVAELNYLDSDIE